MLARVQVPANLRLSPPWKSAKMWWCLPLNWKIARQDPAHIYRIVTTSDRLLLGCDKTCWRNSWLAVSATEMVWNWTCLKRTGIWFSLNVSDVICLFFTCGIKYAAKILLQLDVQVWCWSRSRWTARNATSEQNWLVQRNQNVRNHLAQAETCEACRTWSTGLWF